MLHYWQLREKERESSSRQQKMSRYSYTCAIKEVNDAVATGDIILLYFCVYLKRLRHKCPLRAGKWIKNFFTNGDIVMLLCAIKELGNSNYREALHEIVLSCCETSFTKYQIWQKAQQVQSRITSKRSRRQKMSPGGLMMFRLSA